MTNILFVDDEPLVLEGLQRMLRSLRQEWQMNFLPSGAEALKFMENNPVDVVVADMRMPGMNGAQLLNEVMKRHPQTVRLILSGHADQELILQCVGTTHQYLSKPCDAEMLKRTVRRAATLGNSLQNDAVKRLVARMDRLPTIPSLYTKMIETLQSPEVSLDEVALIVQRDPGMTAKILKLVNSAFFGLSWPIANPVEAISHLGMETVKSLVLCLHVFTQYQFARPGGISVDEVWLHSLRTAEAARMIAGQEDLPVKEQDEAFVGGLLHDVGKLVLACNCAADYEKVCRVAQTESLSLLEAERRIFSCTHADVGGYLLGLWGLPVPVVEALTFHHTPALSLNDCFSPLTAVHAANSLVHEADVARGLRASAKLDQEHLAKLGVADHIRLWRDELRQPKDMKCTL